ncbi:sterol carrier protein domain-containing protein [Streptomyces sioyaensis]|uniref:sterol carrier protein domain-containing protein n=1 Tax=Streptomyces sioyaensis TaxID=67364 RepID=UPI0037AB3898
MRACHRQARNGPASATALLSPAARTLGGALAGENPSRPCRAISYMELAAVSRPAYAALWRFLAGIDLVPWIEYEAAVDEPLPHLLTDPRAVRTTEVDRLWVRLVDVGRALAGRRYATALDVVLDVQDTFCPWNAGRYRLQADGGTVGCARTAAAPDLRLTSAELGAAFLGGTTLAALAAAGLVQELRPGALAHASTAFRGDREPFYPGGWAFPAYWAPCAARRSC